MAASDGKVSGTVGRRGSVEEPVEVGVADGFGMKDEELGDFVGVQAVEGGIEAIEISDGGLDEKQNFIGGFNVTLPAIDGGEPGNEVDTGGEVFLDESMSDARGFIAGACSGEDKTYIGGGYNHRCKPRRLRMGNSCILRPIHEGDNG